jgi:hypothetical protein
MTIAKTCIAALAAALLATLDAGAGEKGAVSAFKQFPVTTFDQDGEPTDADITENNAPPPSSIVVWGYWPNRKMLLIQVGPTRQNAVYISYYAVKMEDQPYWEEKLHAKSNLVCMSETALSHSISLPQGTNISGVKNFKNPC